jgi:PAS domain S-box-containing protein
MEANFKGNYHSIFNLHADIITLSSFEGGKLVFVNDEFTRFSGYTKNEAIGHTLDELNLWVSPRGRFVILDLLHEKKAFENVEVEFINRTGSVRTCLLTAEVIWLHEHKYILVTAKDTTDFQNAEEFLHKAIVEELRSTIRNLETLVFKLMKQPDGQFLYTLSEGKIASDLQMTTDTVFGKTLGDFFPLEIVKLVEDNIKRVENGETVHYEVEVYEKTFLKTLSPIYENGEIVGVAGSGIDITEKKRLEKMLRVSELHSSLGHMAAGVAHEIRNPLTTMSGFAKLLEKLLDKNGIEEGKKYTGIIRSEIDRINHLVSEMLWLHKSEVSAQESVNVAEVLQETIPLIEVETNSRSIELVYHTDSNPFRILADRNKIKQVLLNICKNAVEAMGSGGVLSIHHFMKAAGEQRYITIKITDTGPGIPPEVQEKLFTPFFSTKEDGNGLGLLICNKIVHDIGGFIEISSDPTGTSVYLRFPAN